MLTELSVVEQRYLAVREVLDGARVTDVATRYGIDRRTVHRWLVRYANEGLGALADRSCRPDRCPHQIAPEVEARIIGLRRAHSGWGPRTILSKLRKELEEPPSRSSIYRCLVRQHLIDQKPRRRRPQDYKRWERSRPMELWQMDVLGGAMLEDGTECKVITGIGHLLTAPYSPTTTGKIERLHKTMRKELLDGRRFASIAQAQDELDHWVTHYNLEREHQAIGDVPPIRRFELVERAPAEVVDPDA